MSPARLLEEARVVLRDGSTIYVRRLEPGDTAAIASWFRALSPETRYSRFLMPMKRLDPALQSALAGVNHRDHGAVVAVTPRGATVGIARYMRSADDIEEAEVAVTVGDRWRGRGIATLLLNELVRDARHMGVKRLTALCLATNDAVIKVLTRLGPSTVDLPDAGVVEVRIELTDGES